jgi:iron complex transport system ATP-binding protein
MSLMSVRGMRVRRGARAVLDGVDLTVEPGEVVGLIGPNGAGKTTLLRAALGLMPAEGERTLGGAPVSGLTQAERARRVAYLPQARDVAWALSVARIVALGRLPHRAASAAAGPADHAAVSAAMARMDVAPLAERSAQTLSGGELARVLIARALAQETPLLLADEPTAGLDPAHQIGAMQAFATLAAEGRSVVVSLHDLGLAARWCTRLVLLSGGRVAAEGTAADVLSPERLDSVYGIIAYRAETPDGLILQPLGPSGDRCT